MSVSSVPRLLAVLIACAAVGCDSSDAPLELGTFTAEVRGDARADLAGTARYAPFGVLPPQLETFDRATVTLTGARGKTVWVHFYEPPRVRAYAVQQPTGTATGAVALVGVSLGGEGYGSEGGTVTVTRVSETEVEGEFDVDVECCGNIFTGSPSREARLRGQFSATAQ